MSTLDPTTPDFDQTVNDGQSSIDWEKRFKDTQAELTRVTQQLKNQSQQVAQDPDEYRSQVQERMKKEVIEPEFRKLKGNLTAETEFKQLIDANPNLRQHEKAIKEIANSKGLAYEDVIQEYGFLSEDKLQKAKERSLIGDRTLETQPKSVRDLSESEWKELERSNKNVGAFSQLQSI